MPIIKNQEKAILKHSFKHFLKRMPHLKIDEASLIFFNSLEETEYAKSFPFDMEFVKILLNEISNELISEKLKASITT